MCLVALNWDPDQDTPLVLVANRDEYRARPTQGMHWWSDEPSEMLAGRDLQAGGTWFAVDRAGNFALITNIRPGYVGKPSSLSRGALPRDFIQSGSDIRGFHQNLVQTVNQYGGFNLLLGNRRELFWFSSDNPVGCWLDPGIHVLSNDALNTPWPKAELARQQMIAALPDLVHGEINTAVLESTEPFDDPVLPSTGVPLEWERLLSAQTILGADYGTRSRTWLRLLKDQRVCVTEAQFNESGERQSVQQFKW